MGSRPTVADFRRQAARRDRWQMAAAALCVAAVVALVFWLLPLPPEGPGATPPAAVLPQRSGT